TNQIGQAFGLQGLTVDASGSSEDTNVNVTGYVTPDLYIRYGVGVFNAESTLSARYQLTRRIYVEASSATENAIDVVYSWRF
ncbi:MAG: translocation/assembly module TamB domain-containing protein, partial [Psychrobacter sp.]